MKRTIIPLILILAACATTHPTAAPELPSPPNSGPDASALVQPQPRPGTGFDDGVNTPPPGAEISDDPLVSMLTSDALKQDVSVALQINGVWGDRLMQPCMTWLSAPGTLQRAQSLLTLKGTLQIMPIRPVGPISALAELRRVDHDVSSGALAARIASGRQALDELRTDFALNCGPLLVDLKAAPVRFGAALAAAKKVVLP